MAGIQGSTKKGRVFLISNGSQSNLDTHHMQSHSQIQTSHPKGNKPYNDLSHLTKIQKEIIINELVMKGKTKEQRNLISNELKCTNSVLLNNCSTHMKSN